MPVLFEHTSVLPAQVDAVFRFHENPANMRHIAPASLRIARIDCESTARVGGTFRVEARQFGLPIRWLGRWEVVETDRRLVDSALESPFSHWRHEHLFTPEADGCRLTDRLEFELAGGLPGRLASRMLPALVFGPMFRARHAATREFFARGGATRE